MGIAAPIWTVAQVAAMLVGLTALRAQVLLAAPTRASVVLFGLALAFSPLWVIVAGGNIDGLLFGTFACAVAASPAGRPVLAEVLLGTLVMKPHLFLMLIPAYLLAAPERRKTA